MNKKRVWLVLFVLYCVFIVWMTLIREPRDHRILRMELFWAIRGWINNKSWGKQETIYYLENFLLFIPFGLLFPNSKNWKYIMITALAVSVFIELVQFVFLIGECELDDVVANTIGALIGLWFYRLWIRWKIEWERKYL